MLTKEEQIKILNIEANSLSVRKSRLAVMIKLQAESLALCSQPKECVELAQQIVLDAVELAEEVLNEKY
jgi:hypothetical protein